MSDTITNVIIGAVVTVISALFLPGGPLIGGAVSGYLEESGTTDGVRVGALSGLVALIPLVAAVVGFGGLVFAAVGAGAGPSVAGGFGIAGIAALGALLFGLLVYLVVFGAIGGWIGAYVATETAY